MHVLDPLTLVLERTTTSNASMHASHVTCDIYLMCYIQKIRMWLCVHIIILDIFSVECYNIKACVIWIVLNLQRCLYSEHVAQSHDDACLFGIHSKVQALP